MGDTPAIGPSLEDRLEEAKRLLQENVHCLESQRTDLSHKPASADRMAELVEEIAALQTLAIRIREPRGPDERGEHYYFCASSAKDVIPQLSYEL